MNSFGARLLAHLKPKSANKLVINKEDEALETGKDRAKIVRAENEGWRITSIWLGELRSEVKEKVQDLVFAERTMIFYFDPLFNEMLKHQPSSECTIINRINRTYIEKSPLFEWQATKLPSIWDMRRVDMKKGDADDTNIIAEIYGKERTRSNEFRRRYLAYEPGALWNKKYCKTPPSGEFEKPPIFPK